VVLTSSQLFRRCGVAAALVVAAGACSSGSSSNNRPPETTTGASAAPTVVSGAHLPVVTVSSSARQTIAGFGASGAWWPIDLAHFPESVQREVGQMLFSPSGIELSGYRYNIGGGGTGVTTPDRAPKQYPADTAGLFFLRLANDARVPVLTGFVNSAPPSFTTNGKACGGQLKPGTESAYADYLAGVVVSLRNDQHITVHYVSPMNEPDDSFPDCGQEGMKVPVTQRGVLVRALASALARRAPWAKVIADETTADALTASEVPQWLSEPGSVASLAAIAHHTYDFPNDALRRLLPPMAERFDRPTWMTEICCYKGSGGIATSFGAQYDPTIKQGLWLADQIDADLRVAGDSAWYWWTALSPVLGCDPRADPQCPTRVNTKGFNDGLLYYDQRAPANGPTTIFTTKRFYTLGQFSRYVRPGAVRHDVAGAPAGVRAMAFAHADDWTVVTWNESQAPATFSLSVPDRVAPTGAVVTDAARDLAPADMPLRTTTGTWRVELPPSTIATYTFGPAAH
jgi:O-glycosyl hydrolase